jgi:hypothetical protein
MASIDFARAIDACGLDAHAARGRILEEADAVLGKLVQEHVEDIVTNVKEDV